jgi:hypothetical protein
MLQLGTTVLEHPDAKINADDVFVTGKYKVVKRPPIRASEVENPCTWTDTECQPRKAKRVPKKLFALPHYPSRVLVLVYVATDP